PRAHEPEHLVVGHVSKPHGTRGEVFVWPLTDRPEVIFAYDAEVLLGGEQGQPGEAPETLRVERSRPFKRGLLIKFDGYDDRSAVEPFAQRYLLVPLARLEPLAEDEVYYHQLLGAEVVTVEGERVGRVREVYETKPAHLLEVKSEDGKLHLVPYSERIVKKVDREARRIVIKPPPGLLEL
ncbi:MAG: 16S rRNA processing protein RimM, partial [Gemmatimonadetes bacterium]|nr:16S rRNA processing protein RimM [Gemmatimonadota bacterium]